MHPSLTYCHLPLAEISMKYVWLTHDNRMSKRRVEERRGKVRKRRRGLVRKVVPSQLPHGNKVDVTDPSVDHLQTENHRRCEEKTDSSMYLEQCHVDEK